MGALDGRARACAKWRDPGNGAWPSISPRSPPSTRRPPVPGIELRGPTAHTRIGPQRGHLRDASIRFQAVATDVTADPNAWIAAVGSALSGLGAAWEEHVDFTEGPGGLFEEL